MLLAKWIAINSRTGYEIIPGETKDGEGSSFSDFLSSHWTPSKGVMGLMVFLLVASNSCTWLVARQSSHPVVSCRADSLTPYAKLERNIAIAMGEHNIYTDHNETLRNAAWDAINIDDGMIALPDNIVAEKRLPVAQRFPWDDTKGIYLVNGHHNLHCVRAIYISLMEFWQGKPQSRLWGHVIHCVDALRQEVLCNADDTPRYSTADDNPESGVGQYRMCRSWDQLQDWVKQYNACYRYINQTETMEELPNIERFIYCPEGSP